MREGEPVLGFKVQIKIFIDIDSAKIIGNKSIDLEAPV
jgi:hypothetical protein